MEAIDSNEGCMKDGGAGCGCEGMEGCRNGCRLDGSLGRRREREKGEEEREEEERGGGAEGVCSGLKAAWRKVDAEDVMCAVADGLSVYCAVLVGMKLHSFWCGVGMHVLLAAKRVLLGSLMGDGESGRVELEEMCCAEKLAERCMKHSAWLDGLVTLGLVVAVRLLA